MFSLFIVVCDVAVIVLNVVVYKILLDQQNSVVVDNTRGDVIRNENTRGGNIAGENTRVENTRVEVTISDNTRSDYTRSDNSRSDNDRSEIDRYENTKDEIIRGGDKGGGETNGKKNISGENSRLENNRDGNNRGDKRVDSCPPLDTCAIGNFPQEAIATRRLSSNVNVFIVTTEASVSRESSTQSMQEAPSAPCSSTQFL